MQASNYHDQYCRSASVIFTINDEIHEFQVLELQIEMNVIDSHNNHLPVDLVA